MFGGTMLELIDWTCPQCGETNSDIPDQLTHCAACGRVVLVGEDETMIFEEDWNVPTESLNPQ
jgi:uncharacterized Zn finger protein